MNVCSVVSSVRIISLKQNPGSSSYPSPLLNPKYVSIIILIYFQ